MKNEKIFFWKWWIVFPEVFKFQFVIKKRWIKKLSLLYRR